MEQGGLPSCATVPFVYHGNASPTRGPAVVWRAIGLELRVRRRSTARIIIRKVSDRWDDILLGMARSRAVVVPLVRLEAEHAADLHCQLFDADAAGHHGVLAVRLGPMLRLPLREGEWRALLRAMWDWSVRFEEEEDALDDDAL